MPRPDSAVRCVAVETPARKSTATRSAGVRCADRADARSAAPPSRPPRSSISTGDSARSRRARSVMRPPVICRRPRRAGRLRCVVDGVAQPWTKGARKGTRPDRPDADRVRQLDGRSASPGGGERVRLLGQSSQSPLDGIQGEIVDHRSKSSRVAPSRRPVRSRRAARATSRRPGAAHERPIDVGGDARHRSPRRRRSRAAARPPSARRSRRVAERSHAVDPKDGLLPFSVWRSRRRSRRGARGQHRAIMREDSSMNQEEAERSPTSVEQRQDLSLFAELLSRSTSDVTSETRPGIGGRRWRVAQSAGRRRCVVFRHFGARGS